MLRNLMSISLIVCVTSVITANEKTPQPEGLTAGDPLGAFMVTKVAGAEEDGVEPGQQLCYRCRYGRSPMVMVFTRSTGESVGKLVRKIDAAVEAKKDYRLRGLVTLIGGDANQLTAKAEAMASDINAKNVPIVVANDGDHGPVDYRLNDDTAVTVVIVNYSQVVAVHEFDAEQIDINGVMNEVDRMLD